MDASTARLDKLLARLDSPHRAEAVACAGKVYDYLKANGGSWRDLIAHGVVPTPTPPPRAPSPPPPPPPAPNLVRTPRNLPRRVRRASRVFHFLAPAERARLASIGLELEEFATLSQDDMTFLEEILLRTGT